MLNKKYYNYKGIKICYNIEGKGQTVVLLHGFLENMDIWEAFSIKLREKFTVVLIDLPGHGGSSMIAETHTMEMMAEAVNNTLVSLNIESCVMIGHSMGAYVSLAYADLYNEKLNGLGIFHAHAAADTTEGKINRGRAIQIVKENHKDFISAFIPDLFTNKNKKLFAVEISKLQVASRLISKESVIASLDGMRHRTDKLKLLSNLRIPVMFIIGKQDSRTPLKKMFPQIEIVKHAEVLILNDVAHMGYLEAFDQTLSFTNHFINVCRF